MRSRFSLATLLLLVAIAAVGVGSLRTAIVELFALDDLTAALAARGPVLAACIIGGGLLGLMFGTILGSWNHRGIPLSVASALGGCFLGAAAGAQCTVRTEWPVLFIAPILLIGGTLLVALNERRKRTGGRA
jgi:hypothetical protein